MKQTTDNQLTPEGGRFTGGMVVATLCGVIIVGLLGWALLGPSPPRTVAFDGGWDDIAPSCHGPDVWTGDVAWSACDWAYRKRALVRFDPQKARATVVHRWRVEEGNVPEIQITRPCGDGRLFVIGETNQTTLIVVSGTDARSTAVIDIPGHRVLGADCHPERAAELFVREVTGYSIVKSTNGRAERVKSFATAHVPGSVLAAWFGGGTWHAVVDGGDDGLETGELGGTFSIIEGSKGMARRSCLAGEPGGWLRNRSSCTWTDAVVTHVDGAFQLTNVPKSSNLSVLYLDRLPTFGTTLEEKSETRFDGLDSLSFQWTEGETGLLTARRDLDAATVDVASQSRITNAPRAFPLSKDRIAVWGGLGSTTLVLGQDLQREDQLGPVERVLRPYGSFRASSNSTFDLICYFGLLMLTVGWFSVVCVALVRRRKQGWMRLAAIVYITLIAVGGWGFYEVVTWI